MLAVAHPLKLNDLSRPEDLGEKYQHDKQVDTEIAEVLSSLRHLLIKYKMYSKAKESPVVSGGLQQFIINKLKKRGEQEKTLTQRLKALYLRDESVHFSAANTAGEEMSLFDCMPLDVKLHIFSFLDTRSMCCASSVSHGWNQLLSDDLLWRDRLAADRLTWSQVSHVTNPQTYTEAASDFSCKEIYLRCSPEVQMKHREENSTFHQVSSMLKYLMPKKAPKVAMFGPGLESSTSAIVRKMLYEDQSVFHRVAMFPGQFDGVGAGMTLQLPSGQTFHLSVLYSASRRERENQPQENRMSWNRMLNQQHQQESGEGEVTYELQPALQQLCHTLNAFIFVVDASDTRESVASSRLELITMVQERWATPQVPVLILSCVPTATSPRLPAVEMAQILQLSSFNRPWLVMDCVTDTLENVDKGVLWMIEMCQRK
ncbi:F-box only protein 4-like [Babylonia areolata]|uniref:F-box only protein 4-like n=1 Tax=Babylonia areolata TaxID=304850 RepID=UPI003FD25534